MGARLSGITIDQDKVLFNKIFFLLDGISSCPVTFVTRRLFFETAVADTVVIKSLKKKHKLLLLLSP